MRNEREIGRGMERSGEMEESEGQGHPLILAYTSVKSRMKH